jgi:outer membrane protein assembly factor BamB
MIIWVKGIGVAVLLASTFASFANGQEKSPASPPPTTTNVRLTPATLPGQGLAQHDFLYAGEGKDQRMYIVRKGTIVWSYANPGAKGEISDAVLMSNGNILFAHQFGVTMISPEKKIVWNYDAPDGAEIHTAQPIGKEKVLFIQNGNPALLRVVNTVTGKTLTEFNLPVGNPQKVHPQFRHARITDSGTVLVAHLDMQKVAEYDVQGREVWSYSIDGPWSAVRLKNGNTLIATSKKLIREVDSQGATVWELKPEDLPDYKISNFQIATRLATGNTLLNNWANIKPADDKANGPVQAVEVTADKKIVWALRSWVDPNDLGPATTIQILDQPSALEKVHFGDIH